MNPNPKHTRVRDKNHLRDVSELPCLVCGNTYTVDAHHLTFAEEAAMGIKVGDNFTVPLCRQCHTELHMDGGELIWWASKGIDPLGVAEILWTKQ